MRRRDRYPLRKSRHARPEICGHSIDQRAKIYGLLSRRSADALESMRDALEPLEIRLHVVERRGSRRLWLRLSQQLDPAADAGERGTELMRRFSRHSRPDLFAIGPTARAKRVCTGEKNHADEDRLQHGDEYQSPNERRVSVVNGSNGR